MKKTLLTLSLLVLAVSAASFTTVEHGRLMRNGQPYRFVGTNFWYGPILASTGRGGDRLRLHRELDALQAMGVENLRVLVGSDGASDATTKVTPTLQEAPSVYNDTLLDGLDYFMAELDRRNMQAVLYLNNSWEWSGGYGYYLQQAGQGKAPLSSEVSWQELCSYYSRFSTCRAAQQLFFEHIRFIVGRTNRYTGRPYSEDPALMAWQIGNEPRAFSTAAKDSFAIWLSEAAALIRSLDANHLISIGSEGIIGCEGDQALYQRICADCNIDILNFHLWPSNWGWASKTIESGDIERSIDKSRDYIARHESIAAQLGKPLILEEFGYPRDGGSKAVGTPVVARDIYYDFILSRLVEAVQQGDSPLMGVNFWAWGGGARPVHEAWHVGDDYCGDPPHEPQGLYSVFDNDSITVGLIRSAAQALAHISDSLITTSPKGILPLATEPVYTKK